MYELRNTRTIILIAVTLCYHATPCLSSLHPSPFTLHQEDSPFTLHQEDSPFTLHQEHDSLYWLNDWRLPYPVYRFETGDVDGDGREDAMVGVIKSTRFHPEKGRRLFVFKEVDGKVRPLWLGSRLGAILIDFRFIDGRVRALETDGQGRYGVTDYRWQDFGMAFDRFIIKNTDQETAYKYFNL